MLRTPVRSFLFLCLLALSMCLLLLGIYLRTVSEEQMHTIEAGFTTIGTVRQIQNSLVSSARWDAGSQTYSYYSYPVYDIKIPLSVLDFDAANYIHPPEKRPYYGAYDSSFIITEDDAARNAQLEEGQLIIEVQPLEDCVPAGPVRVKIVRVLYGELADDEIWFCEHIDKDPTPMLAGKTYVMHVQPMLLSFTHPDHPSEFQYESEYWIANTIASRQYNKNGERVADEIDIDTPWEEVTEGYYNTPRGKRWLAMMEGYQRFKQTIPVTPTNNTNLLMAFYNGDAVVSEGRDITDEEYSSGRRVCLVSRTFAQNNNLHVGDQLTLPLYYANYDSPTNLNFSYNGGGGMSFSLINAKGEVYSVFDSDTYTIVGVYEGYGFGFDLGWNEVIIPTAAIMYSDEDNIVAYSPMKASNTSFQIPNGGIEAFMEEWNKLGITNLDIQFFDKGYTKLKAGLDAMKNVSFVLLLSGAATMLLILVFFTYLFISKQKKRTAIERSLGMSKSLCGLSLLAGIMLIVLLGGFSGGAASYLISSAVQEQIIAISQEAYFDTNYSNWVNNADEQAKLDIGISKPDLTTFAGVGVIVALAAAAVALLGIRSNLRSEPLTMLSTRKE